MSEIKKILLAEDELLIAKVLRMQLEQRGYEVKNVTTANEAADLAISWQPDLIILDVFLKNSTCGIDAGKNIRNAGISTPIIYTTGNSYQSTLKDLEVISNAQLLTKPVEFEYLMQVVKQL